MITVKELREAIEGLPDSATVEADDFNIEIGGARKVDGNLEIIVFHSGDDEFGDEDDEEWMEEDDDDDFDDDEELDDEEET